MSHITAILTVITLAVGLYATWDQIKGLRENLHLTNKSTAMATWNSVSQQWLDLDKQFVDKPALRQYIFGRVPTPAENYKYNDKEQAIAIETYVLNFIDNALIVGDYLKDTEITHISEWKDTFNHIFMASPGICDIVKKHKKSYSTFTRDLIKPYCDLQ